MIERRTSIVEVGGVVGYRKACEEKEGQELKHAWCAGGNSSSGMSITSFFTLAIILRASSAYLCPRVPLLLSALIFAYKVRMEKRKADRPGQWQATILPRDKR